MDYKYEVLQHFKSVRRHSWRCAGQTGPQSASEKLLGRMLKFSPKNEGRHVSTDRRFMCSEKQTTRYIDWQTRLIPLMHGQTTDGRLISVRNANSRPVGRQGKIFQTDLVKQIMIHKPGTPTAKGIPGFEVKSRFQPERKTSSSSRLWSSSMF